MTALVQFEIDRGRLSGFPKLNSEEPMERVRYLARMALADTFNNGGTFVMVVSADKITIVQRSDAEDLNEKAPEGEP